MKLFSNKNKYGYDSYKKYEPKQYEPYSWVKDNLKFGFVIFVIGLIIYGIYKLIEWI